MRITALALALLAATSPLLPLACKTKEAALDEVPRQLRGRSVLVQLEDLEPADLVVGGARRPEILIDVEGAISGFGGVNRFGSSLDMDVIGVERFVLTPIASNMMAGEPAAMQLESRFLQALQDARRYRLEGDRLELSLEDEVLVVLQRQR